MSDHFVGFAEHTHANKNIMLNHFVGFSEHASIHKRRRLSQLNSVNLYYINKDL